MNSQFQIVPFLRGLLGAAVGGAVGYFVYTWILTQGLYAMIIPGAALGYGFAMLSRQSSPVYGVACAILAIGLGLFAEWKTFPFIDDGSFQYLLNNVHEILPIHLIMIALGGLIAFWSGRGRASYPGETTR